jgi:hypothetical protein
MSVQEILQNVEFVVDHNGKAKAAVVDMQLWALFLAWLEQTEALDIEDRELVQSRLVDWPSKKGWTRWEDFEAELSQDALSVVD